jgi:hypothetical protein
MASALKIHKTRHSIVTQKRFKYQNNWERDEQVKSCRGCTVPFSLTTRRHHCRACGKIYCAECSSEVARVSGSKNAKRVCKWCKLELVPQGFNRMSFSDAAEQPQGDTHKPRTSSATTTEEKNWSANPLDTNAVLSRPAHARAETMNNDTLVTILSIDGNKSCVDCNSDKVEWASLSMGTVMCLQCSGVHRSYGSHISFVRSLQLDRWDPTQIKRMTAGGNTTFRNFMLCKSGGDGGDGGGAGGSGGGASGGSGGGASGGGSGGGASGGSRNNNTAAEWDPSHELYASDRCEWYRNKIKASANGDPDPPPFDPAKIKGNDGTQQAGDVAKSGHDGHRTQKNGSTNFITKKTSLMSNPSNLSLASGRSKTGGDLKKDKRPTWIKDTDVKNCMHCKKEFTLLRRRHHCRKCGHCICVQCAPNDNTRPIPEFGYTKEVRLCLECFRPFKYQDHSTQLARTT